MGRVFKAIGKFLLLIIVGSVFIVASLLKEIVTSPITLFHMMKKPSGDPNTANMQWFWTVINSSNMDREVLYNILRKQSRYKILIFHHCFEYAATTLRCHPYIDEQDPEEIDDICHWVISQGENTYRLIFDNPEMMPQSVRGYSDKILYGVADRIFYKKYNKPIRI